MRERRERWEGIEREREKDKNVEWKERVKELERKWEVKERGERRRNILIKGLKDGEGKAEEKSGEDIGRTRREDTNGGCKENRKGKTERGNLVIVRLGSESMRRRILMTKWKLKGGREFR